MVRLLLALLLAVSTIAPARAETTVRREIDPATARALFAVSHIYVDRVTGTVPIVGGTVVFPVGSSVPISVTAELEPARIKSGDDDRDASLQGPDWFDVKRFPAWTFASTKIVATAKDAFAMDGILTIHGIARNEHLDVTVAGTPAHPSYHAIGTIDRRAFGMTVTRLDPVIGGTVNVTLDVTLK